MKPEMLAKIKNAINNAMKGDFYKKRFEGIDINSINSKEDFEKLPFTDKGDLREAYPLDYRLYRMRKLSEFTHHQEQQEPL